MTSETGTAGDEGREPVGTALCVAGEEHADAGTPAGYQEEGWFFTGRKEVLGRIVAWLEAGGPGLFLVTGPAGCGKSAVLGRIAALTDPVRRQEAEAHGGLREDDPDPGPRPGRSLASVHLRGPGPLRAAAELARQLGLPEPRSVDGFRGELRGLSPQPVLVLDGLDEVPAEHLRTMIDELVLPLSRTGRVLLGSREQAFLGRVEEDGRGDESLPDALARLIGADVTAADLAREPQTREDIGACVFRRCAAAGVPPERAREAADAVAARAVAMDGGFLFARLVTGSLLAGAGGSPGERWAARLPDSVEAAFEEDLRAGPVRVRADGTELPSAARDLLTALAWSAGRGMPAGGVWEEVAGALGGRDVPYDGSDVDWLLSAYGRHVVEDAEDGRAVYRLCHRAFASCLAGPDRAGAGETVVAALVAHAERRMADGGWGAVDRYVARGLASHAARAGAPGIGMLRGLAGRVGEAAAPVLAQALRYSSERLGAEGDPDGAPAHAREALALYRELEHAAPGSRTAALVRSLVDVAERYAALGDRAAAAAPAREAAALGRDLAEAGADGSLSGPALDLGALGARLHALGDHEGALALTGAAVALHRQSAARAPAAFRPGLAAALNGLAAAHAAAGDHRASVPPAREAVEIRTELAGSHPDEFLGGLAASLTLLADGLGATGSHAEALAHAERAVQAGRRAAERHPAVRRPALAASLAGLSVHREHAGDLTGSLAPAREAVEICRDLVAARPDAFQGQLAGALQNLADRISATGDREGALAPAREAARLYAGLAIQHQDVFRPDLARSLSSLADKTAASGDRASAVLFAREAVRIQRELTAERPTESLPGLASMLSGLAGHRIREGEPGPALPHAEEATEIYRRLAADAPDTFLPEFATALDRLGNHRASLGDISGALASGREAVSVRRVLAARQPAVFRQDLATALTHLAAHLDEAGDPAAGARAAEEAVALHREAAGEGPGSRAALASSLGTLAQNLADAGSRKEALGPSREGVRLLRGLAGEPDGAFLPQLARALHGLAGHLGLDDDEEAVRVGREAVAAYRALALESPGDFENALVSALTELTRALVRTGDRASAVREFDEAVAEFAPVHAPTARRLGVERSVFLLGSPGPRALTGLRALVAFLDEDSDPDDGVDAVTVRARRALRAHGDAETVRTVWEEETFTSAPAWLTLSPRTLDLVGSWMFAPDWPRSRDAWSQNADVLGSEEAATALEELAFLDPRTAQRHAALRRAVLAHGVTAAYDPLILAEQLAEWVECADWAESRAFLQEHPRLLTTEPSPSTPLAHVAVLEVGRTEGLDAAYRLVEDRDALQVYVERALAAGDSNALMHAAAVEGEVFDDKLSSLTHAQAGMVLAGAVDDVEPEDLATLLPRAPELIRARLLREILALSGRYAHPHGETWLRIVRVLGGTA
ncbi:tetratricopeptide repeat protein [Streptomyces sp. NPDC057697]|uniref:tetratricopeptide repeat protein n=1 Tax=Streptomyces sp. NPDC057697 TaxID=3346219 RepID=UPI0036C9665A